MSIRLLLFRSASLLAKAIPANARWITVHPNGPGDKGQPILIQPAGDGAYKVIGGAGGKLNHLRINNVRSEADFAQEVRQKASTRRDEKKRQKERDKKDGLTESKARARETLKAEVGEHEAKFIKTVAAAVGWTPEQMRFPAEKFTGVTPAAAKKAEADHARGLYKKAHEAVDMQRRRLLEDAEARAESGIGEIPMVSASPDQISVQDLDPVEPSTKGFGYSTDYAKRAADQGLDEGELRQEAAAAKPADPGRAERTDARKVTTDSIAAELKAIRDPGPPLDARAKVDARQAIELLKAAKELQAVRSDARRKAEKIDGAREPVEAKAYALETVSRPVDSDVVRGLENDLRTIKTRAFLSAAASVPGGLESLGRHIGVGGYNAVNALALAAGGASLIDRSVVDVLGIAGAAQVLARRLQSDLTPEELDHVREAVGKFHVDRYMEMSDSSLREAREWQEMASEIELGEASTGADLQIAQEMNAKRRTFIGNAQSVLGTAYGEMEGNAALVTALGQPKKPKISMSLGAVSIEDGIRQARAIGLDRGDYQVERAGNSTMLTVHGPGMDKLAQPVSKAEMTHLRGALDIIDGRKDEEDWLPAGVARRPDLAMNIIPGTAPRLAKPFPKAPADMAGAMADYIGARAADGDSPAEIVADLASEETMQRAGNRGGFMETLDKLAPNYGPDGKMIRVETHAKAFEAMADAYTAKIGADRAPIHRQQFAVGQVAVDALHRALAEHPDGIAAFKPIGDLTSQDQGALRRVFSEEYGRSDPAAEGMRSDLAKLDAAEPEKETEDMFGRSINPDWRDWQGNRNDLAEKLNGASMGWDKYLATMGSPANAYAAMQDVVRSKVLKAFADQHNRANPKKPLAIGRSVIANDLNHLDALDPAARERRQTEHRARVDALRNRAGGKYSAGTVSDKLDAARAQEEALEQSQMGMFGNLVDDGGEQAKSGASAPARAPELGERWTIGHAAERQIAGMMPIVGANFRPGQKTELWQSNMSGKYVGRQRAVKLIRHNKRMGLGLGTGSGKTSIMLSAFTDLHASGDTNRGLFLVPSVVQGQFHGEALTMLEPGKYNWHCNPGAGRAERIAAYRDPKVNFSVVTHQAFRDDMLHLAAERDGSTPKAIAEKLDTMPRAERATFMRGVMEAHGIDHKYLAVDEGHNLLNRAGKQNSNLANVVDSVSDGMGHYVTASADPVKNDSSEAFDVLQKLNPQKYSDRDAFMRKYGVNTAASRDGLQREMAQHFYTGRIDPGVKADHQEINVPLSVDQHAELKSLSEAAAAGRVARINGTVDTAAMKKLTPKSFEGVDPSRHQEIAGKLQQSIGVVYDAARHHAIDGGAKTDALAKVAHERRGKPGVVFVHHIDRVHEIAARLTKEGHRVATMTGANSGKEKDAIKAAFKAGKHDILISSDAGCVGANLQTGQWLCQYDTPMTAMAQPLHSKVLTPAGWRLMGELRVGDPVLCPDGTIAPIIGVHPQGEKEIYRVSFTDGASTLCCLDHLWTTKSRDDVKRGRGWRVRTLSHLKRTLTVKEGERLRLIYHIPLVGKLDFPSYDMPIDPYVLGVLLGDGNFGKSHVEFFSADLEITARVRAAVELVDCFLSKVGENKYRLVGDKVGFGYPKRSNNAILEGIRSLCIVGGDGEQKFIPTQYLFASQSDRLALLQGLMDTDGTVDKRNGYSSFCNTSWDLIQGVVDLARSLGGVASVGPGRDSFYRGKKGKTHWKVSVYLPVGSNPFSLTRKAEIVDRRKSRMKMRRGIASVEFVRFEAAQCIEIDHPDHLYVTDDFIVTHNTHAQRNGRIHRMGQRNDVELLDLVADHSVERKARARLATKYGLRDVMTSPLEGLDDRGVAGYLNRARSGTLEAAQPLHVPVAGNNDEPETSEDQGDMFGIAA